MPSKEYIYQKILLSSIYEILENGKVIDLTEPDLELIISNILQYIGNQYLEDFDIEDFKTWIIEKVEKTENT